MNEKILPLFRSLPLAKKNSLDQFNRFIADLDDLVNTSIFNQL